jgi:hypothetical protein
MTLRTLKNIVIFLLGICVGMILESSRLANLWSDNRMEEQQ